MKSLLSFTTLVLVFFLLAFFLGFGRVVPTTAAFRAEIPEEALSLLREQVGAVASLLSSLPDELTAGVRACVAALAELGETLRAALQREREQTPPEGALLV